MKKIALYPGSFNPIHKGHIEIIKEAAQAYDKLYVFVANNEIKRYPILITERLSLVQDCVKELGLDNVEVIQQKEVLTPMVAKELGAQYIVRGLRKGPGISEYEAGLADSYLEFNDDLIFNYITIEGNDMSSTIIRERIMNREDISDVVPKVIEKEVKWLYEKI